eukprot:TRINITY_DN21411_c0_g1_i1.p2 TRINITY_DN21411_c0_g1~~TRINITY_DN21411_c0_g1_i1.p2  ORF type:complete len:223 (-),score=46.06 TRINITY_DN21411_c0_g1_i1:209-877(-)
MASGAGVCALMYKDGVVMATDTLLSYGSLAKWPRTERVFRVTDELAMAASADFADFQSLISIAENFVAADRLATDGIRHGPEALFNAFANVLFNQRCRMSPLRIAVVVCGYDKLEKKPFLGTTLLDGNRWAADYAVTGLVGHMAVPLLREFCEKHPVETRTKEMVEEMLRTVMGIGYLRDCRAGSHIQLTTATADGVTTGAPEKLRVDDRWDVMPGHSTELQ